MIRIKIEVNNIADLWKLKCVTFIEKQKITGRIAVGVVQIPDLPLQYGYTGDEIQVESEQSETGRIIYRAR